MSDDVKSCFKAVPANVNLNELELQILQVWQQERVFQQSVQQRQGCEEYIFYDGPPFANGLPHYGHILTSYIKDTVPRYFTMRGKRVERRFGWDCHGLPAENSAEKELNINGKHEIEAYGIDRFNAHCCESVLKYTSIWEEMVTRLGRWVDFDHDYKTMDLDYMESILWVFKTLYDQGLIYEGNKVLHYCYRCQTPLSNFEAKLDDAYRERKDLSLTVKFKVPELDASFLVWTTTPWTLPSNVALAVGKDITYLLIKHNSEQYIIAKECLRNYQNELEEIHIIKEIKGEELVGLNYQPLFPYFADTANAFQVYAADFVNIEDGTGIVHIAPAFGEDDAALGQQHDIAAPDPVDSTGCFTEEVTDFAGRNVHEVNEDIAAFLKERDQVFKAERFAHSYPYCWRCDTPLIYKAIPSWYMAVTKIKTAMLKNNQLINWIPEHIKDGIFGKWLEGAKDWAISRNRYWGSPVPVWKCDECGEIKVIGSLQEIADLTGEMPTDLHRPAIDAVTFPCAKCSGVMQRIPEVLDCWFESGSMPYAQLHYPFENSANFSNIFPADFIVEYISQTRGWFYTLVVLAAALFDRPPFKNAVVHGVIFAEDGRKMSKRLKNYPDPSLVLEKYGSDAMRFYLLGSPVLSGKNINFAESGVQEVIRSLILPLWNAYRFFVTYAQADNFTPQDSALKLNNYLDRYIVAKLQQLIANVEQHMDSYDMSKACREIVQFIDVLNNTYIRRSRRRFWKSESDADKFNAYQTLYRVLIIFCRVVAPLLPFVSEAIYRNLTGKLSVHLANWPVTIAAYMDAQTVDEVERVQQIVKVGRLIREKAGVKVREPRAKVTVAGIDLGNLANYQDWIKEELNVKAIEISEDVAGILQRKIKLKFKQVGPKLGKDMQRVIQLINAGDYQDLGDDGIKVDAYTIDPDDYQVEMIVPEDSLQTDDGKIMVSIDMQQTPEFWREGVVRDLVRFIQLLRKEADYNVSDRIVTVIKADAEVAAIVTEYADYVKHETLTLELNKGDIEQFDISQTLKLEDKEITVSLKRC